MSEESNKFKFEVKVPGVDEMGKATAAAIDVGSEAVKGFLIAVCKPYLVQLGGLFGDKMAYRRIEGAIQFLAKANDYCQKHNIKLKQLPRKQLVPLLDFASLEDDEQMQDKWAVLLGNMVDSEQNVDNNVFPYILSQISTTELVLLEKAAATTTEYRRKIKDESSTALQQAVTIKNKLTWPVAIPRELPGYEKANLVRLGLIKERNPNQLIVRFPSEKDDTTTIGEVKPDIFQDLIMTDLGELFIKACNRKQ